MTDVWGHVLVVDDDPDVLLAAELLIKRQVCKVNCLSEASALPEFLSQHKVDVVLLDMNFTLGNSSGDDGLQWLAYLQARHPEIVVVLMTVVIDVVGLGAGACLP